MREKGFSAEVIALTEPNNPPPAGPSTVVEEIVWYVDAMLSGSEPKRIKERVAELYLPEGSERSERNKQANKSSEERYGPGGYHQRIVEWGHQIGEKFSRIIGFTGNPDDLPLYLKQKFEERVIAFLE